MPLYDDFERSNFLGRDVRLYSFIRGPTSFHYTSGDRDIAFDGTRYVQLAIVDDGMKQKSEVVTDDFTITVPLFHPVAVWFRGTPPSDLIKVLVRQVQYGDTEAPLMWTGYVSAVKIKDTVSADIVCNTQVAYLNRRGLRLNYTRQCPHALYDEQCRVNKADWAEVATVRDLTGNSFHFDLETANPDAYVGRFTSGFIEWQISDDGTMERRAVQTHDNDLCILLNNTDAMAEGMQITMYPGCSRVPANCKLFNNIANYGGFPMMPGKSPFDGDPVF